MCSTYWWLLIRFMSVASPRWFHRPLTNVNSTSSFLPPSRSRISRLNAFTWSGTHILSNFASYETPIEFLGTISLCLRLHRYDIRECLPWKKGMLNLAPSPAAGEITRCVVPTDRSVRYLEFSTKREARLELTCADTPSQSL